MKLRLFKLTISGTTGNLKLRKPDLLHEPRYVRPRVHDLTEEMSYVTKSKLPTNVRNIEKYAENKF
jgi:hypothetical protein